MTFNAAQVDSLRKQPTSLLISMLASRDTAAEWWLGEMWPAQQMHSPGRFDTFMETAIKLVVTEIDRRFPVPA